MDPMQERLVDYSADRLVWDEKYQREVLSKIAKVGAAVEKAIGSAQDIEGVVLNGEIYVVQTRPLV